jgi:hypothetical protein
MGYYTSYNLVIQNGDHSLIETFRKENEDANYALNEEGYTLEYCKWYNHEEDLKTFSAKYPEVLFILEGEGEEPGDMWKKYFQNGKCQTATAQITFEKFNPDKLR